MAQTRTAYIDYPPLDWYNWRPSDRATLMLIQYADKLLLIHKKRGLGAGKVTAPGGKLEQGETGLACAIRETAEEVGLTVSDGIQMARLKFQFTKGFALQVEVFLTHQYSGTLHETDEAIPFWAPCSHLPFDAMWADDRLWLLQVLKGHFLCGHFVFSGDKMLANDIHPVASKHFEDVNAY